LSRTVGRRAGCSCDKGLNAILAAESSGSRPFLWSSNACFQIDSAGDQRESASDETIYGTRNLPGDQNTYGAPIASRENYGENASQSTVANSNYNALEATLRYQRNGSQFLLSYTYAKSIDQGSNLGEQIDPRNPRQQRTISAWDQKDSFGRQLYAGTASREFAAQVQSSDR
jgi:hypothetical protein